MRGHTGPIWCLAVREDRLFSAADDTTVIVWDADCGKKLDTLSSHTSAVRCMVEADGMLLTGSEGGVLLCSRSAAMTRIFEVRAHAAAVTCLLVAADDSSVFTGSADALIKRWDPTRGGCLATFRGHTEWVTCLVVADGALFSGSRDRTIRRWHPSSARLLATFEHGTVSFRQRSSFLSAQEDGTVSVSRVSENEKFTRVDHGDGTVSLRTARRCFLSVGPTGRVSACSQTIGRDERLELQENSDGTVSIRSHHGSFVGCSDEGFACAGRGEGAGREVPSAEERFAHCLIEQHWGGVTSLLATSGALMSGAADRSVKLWDPATGMLMASLDGRSGVTCLIEADGSLFAGAARGTPLRLPRTKGCLARSPQRGQAQKAVDPQEESHEAAIE